MTQTSSGQRYDNRLLISRTDSRGVIQAANQAFQEVCGYDWSEMQNAPHKIVRHPDMPKGVFFLLWRQLQKGEPVGAFVKNLKKGGGHYWVFATMAILDTGFMSMRIMATESVIAMIAPIYATMRHAENNQGISPEESMETLLGALKDLGYPTYESFIARMAAQQLLARQSANGVQKEESILRMLNLLKEWPEVGRECGTVFHAYEEFGVAPLNMRIQASQLKENGIALGVISGNFAELASDINKGLEEFVGSVDGVAETINRSMFLTCTQRLLIEAADSLAVETGDGATGIDEIDIMQFTRSIYEQKAMHGLRETRSKLTEFIDLAKTIKRSLTGLSVTRVMSAIENAQFNGAADNSISAIIEELRVFQEVTDTSLLSIQGHLTRLSFDVQRSIAIAQANSRIS